MSPNNPSDGRAERHLRVEAGAAQWQECDEAQQQAYLRIAEMIAEAIRDMPPLDAPPREQDAVRRSRSAFVIGGRGTGKTTVLDTLRRDSQPRTRRDEKLTPVRPGLDDRGRRRQQEWATQRQDLLQQIRGRVVWLETLDMEPLPPETNLLASILVRLEAAAKGFGGEGAAATRKPRLTRGLIEPSSDYHSALLDLQRLQNDVALAWEGNLRERRGSLDPDAYAVEVMRVETSRLSLNSKFDDTLRKLAQNVFRGRDVDDVLFILPVDDFDLNPPICLDLLRLLRLISIPRLFTIALGDLNVASTVMSLKLSNDLGSIVRQLQFPMLAVVPATVASLAGDVSANAIRKLLPPAQRVALWPMRLPEAMNFRPLGSTDQDAYLHELLARCPVQPGWDLPPVPQIPEEALEREQKTSLRRLLLAPPLSDSAWLTATSESGTTDDEVPTTTRALPRTVAERAIYSGAQFLYAPPRRIADTWLELHQIYSSATRVTASQAARRITEDREAFDQLLSVFAETCRAALRETPIFMPEERDDVERAVSRTVGGSWTLRPLPVTIRTETTSPRPIELMARDSRPQQSARRPKSKTDQPQNPASRPPAHIHVAESLGWQIEIYTGSNRRPGTSPPGVENWEERRPRRLLSENAVSALIVYHDLLAFAPGEAARFRSALLTPASLAIDWAATEWKLTTPITFEWPAPPCTAFFDYDCFKSAWNDVIKADTESVAESQVERLVFAWIAIGTAVVKKEPPRKVRWWDGPVQWDSLLEQLQQMAEAIGIPTFADAQRYTEWLRRVAELLMPELGVPEKICTAFSSATPLYQVWIKNRSVVLERRLNRLRKVHEVDPELAEDMRRSSFGEELNPQKADVTGVAEPASAAATNVSRSTSAAAGVPEPAASQ